VDEVVRDRSNCIDCSNSSCGRVGDDCGNALTILGGLCDEKEKKKIRKVLDDL